MLAMRAWGVVIRERWWFGAGAIGGRICGVCGGGGNEVYISTFDWWEENRVVWMAISIYCYYDVVFKLLPVHVARGNRRKQVNTEFYALIAELHLKIISVILLVRKLSN